MTKTIFITGTDTDVGKTYFACQFITQLKEQGNKVAALKPVASGASLIEGYFQHEDAYKLRLVANMDQSYKHVNPFLLIKSVSPNIAAANENKIIRVDTLKKHYDELLAKNPDFIIIEGAGGWFCPINETETLADFAKAIQASIILVVRLRLGCLNHALLTTRAIDAANLNFLGWIANTYQANMDMLEENITTLKQRITAPMLQRI